MQENIVVSILFVNAVEMTRYYSPAVTQHHFFILDERLENRGDMSWCLGKMEGMKLSAC